MYIERRTFWLAGLGLLILAALVGGVWMLKKPEAPALPAEYGAIALSGTSLGFGASWGYADPNAAGARAQAECAHAGGSHCAVRVAVAGRCAALVTTAEANHAFAVTDTDKTSASALALAECQASGARDCMVQTNFCGSGA